MGLFGMFKGESLESLMNKEILRSYNTEREEGIFSKLSYSECKKYLLAQNHKETSHDSGNVSIRFTKMISNKEVDVTFMAGPGNQTLIYTQDSDDGMQDALNLLRKAGVNI